MTINFHQIKNFVRHFFTAKRNGHGVHSPFAYQLCEEVFYNKNKFYYFEELNTIRNLLLTNETEIIVEDFGAGSKTFNSNKRRINALAKNGISTNKQSEILFKLLNFLNCKSSIELGTSLGLNTLYLALANKYGEVKSIEGSKNLFDFATSLSEKNNIHNIKFIHSTFDKALPMLLTEINSLDFFYVDGNHTYEATITYFKQALTKKNNQSVFVFDDIYWSKEMTEAWRFIINHEEVTLSIDAFYFGFVFFRKEISSKTNLKFYI